MFNLHYCTYSLSPAVTSERRLWRHLFVNRKNEVKCYVPCLPVGVSKSWTGTSFSASWLPMNVRYKLKHMTDNYLVYHTTSFQNMGQTNRHTVLLEARYSSLTNAGLFLLKPFLIQTLLC